MPLQGEYEPSSSKWVRDQVEEYENSGGTRGTTLRGVPVVVISPDYAEYQTKTDREIPVFVLEPAQ